MLQGTSPAISGTSKAIALKNASARALIKTFLDDSLKQAYAKWVKEVKDKSPHKASWRLGQAEVKLDSVVSTDNKINHEFSTYLSCVQNQKASIYMHINKESNLT
jgi:hypothetical protein